MRRFAFQGLIHLKQNDSPGCHDHLSSELDHRRLLVADQTDSLSQRC
jgi:hypothetical protein